MPEVDAEHRHPRRPGQLGGPQQRAVAAEHDHDLAAGGGLLVVRRRPRRPAGPSSAASSASTRTLMPAAANRAAAVRTASQRLVPAGVPDEQHVAARRGHAVPPRPRPRAAHGRAAAAPRRSQRKYSTLPAGPGQRAGGHAGDAQPVLLVRRRRHRRDRGGPQLRLPDHAAGAQRLAAHLELRLDHRHQVGVRAPRPRPAPGSTRRSEMKDRSATTRSTGSADRGRRQVAHVGAVHAPGPGRRSAATRRAGRSRRRRTTTSRSAAPQQHVGEAAGRRAGVQRPPPGDRQPVGLERVQRAGQLVAAAGHVGLARPARRPRSGHRR